MNIGLLLGDIMIILGFSLGVFIVCIIEETKTKGLCVDGDGDLNLEGMMCEKTESSFYGEDIGAPLYVGILMGTCGFIILGGVITLLSDEWVKNNV